MRESTRMSKKKEGFFFSFLIAQWRLLPLPASGSGPDTPNAPPAPESSEKRAWVGLSALCAPGVYACAQRVGGLIPWRHGASFGRAWPFEGGPRLQAP